MLVNTMGVGWGKTKYFGATNWNGKWGIERREDFPGKVTFELNFEM